MTPATGRLGGLLALGALLGVAAGLGACGTADPGATATTVGTKTVDQAGFFEREIWQTDLKVVGCYGDDIDGRIQPSTESALRAFQQAAGLPVDGRYDDATNTALRAAVADGRRVCSTPGTTGPHVTLVPPPLTSAPPRR